MRRFPKLAVIEIDSSFVYVADIRAEIYTYLFWPPYW